MYFSYISCKQNSSCLNTKLCAQLILDYVKANIQAHYVAFGGTCMNSQVSFEWKWVPHTCNCMPLQKSLRKYAYRYWLANKSYMPIEQQKQRKVVVVMLFVISSGCFRKKGRNYFLLVSTESQYSNWNTLVSLEEFKKAVPGNTRLLAPKHSPNFQWCFYNSRNRNCFLHLILRFTRVQL